MLYQGGSKATIGRFLVEKRQILQGSVYLKRPVPYPGLETKSAEDGRENFEVLLSVLEPR